MPSTPDPTAIKSSTVELLPASAFTYDELVEAYNHTRVDYLVPMPMNAARLREYVQICDVDLAASAVAVDGNEVLGLAMLGLRPGRAWITRLGVIRSNRRQGTGTLLVKHMIRQACQNNVHSVVLEVIKNNSPAHNLFLKEGFKETREMLVLRRPPNPPPGEVVGVEVEALGYDDAIHLLQRRTSIPSWFDEYPSMVNAGGLAALRARLADGSQGWLVYQNTVFQLGRLVIETERGDPVQVGRALLYHLHTLHPVQDTKTENLLAEDPHWPAFKDMGYLEMFRRIEMVLPLKEAP